MPIPPAKRERVRGHQQHHKYRLAPYQSTASISIVASPVYDGVVVAVLHRRHDLLEQPLRLLERRPPLGHDVIKQLPVRCVLLSHRSTAWNIAGQIGSCAAALAMYGGSNMATRYVRVPRKKAHRYTYIVHTDTPQAYPFLALQFQRQRYPTRIPCMA